MIPNIILIRSKFNRYACNSISSLNCLSLCKAFSGVRKQQAQVDPVKLATVKVRSLVYFLPVPRIPSNIL